MSVGIPSDTSEQVTSKVLGKLKKLSPQDRMLRMFELCSFGTELMKQKIRQKHPDISKDEEKRELLKRRYGEELAKRLLLES